MNQLLRLVVFTGILFFSGVFRNGYAQRAGHLYVGVQDASTGKPTPVRIRLTLAGKPVMTVPDETVSISYGLWDHADGYAFQPDSSFYVSGLFSITLPPGVYQLAISKGNEYIRQTHQLRIQSGQTVRQKLPNEALDQYGCP